MDQVKGKALARPEEVTYTQEELEDRLAYWQHKLRLQDWLIEIQIKRVREMESSNEAEIAYSPHIKQAQISIAAADDKPHSDYYPHDMEWLIVHELLHLHFYAFKDEEGKNIVAIEQAIESITHGFMVLERK